MKRYVVEPQRRPLGDQFAEHAAPSRQRADLTAGPLIDPHGDEPREPCPGFVEHPQRRVLGTGQVARSVEHALQHRLGVEIFEDGPSNCQHFQRRFVH